MTGIEPRIRNAVRALIIQNDQVLLLKKDGYETGGVRYALPGGGQDAGESLEQAVQRECLEEIGCSVRVGDLVAVTDFIKQRDTEPVTWRHVVESLFLCELPEDYQPANGPAPDKHQVDVVWMPVSDLPTLKMFPQFLSTLIPGLQNTPRSVYHGRFVDPGFSE